MGSVSWLLHPGFLLPELQLLWSWCSAWQGGVEMAVRGHSGLGEPCVLAPAEPLEASSRLSWGLMASLLEVMNPQVWPPTHTHTWLHPPPHSGHHRRTSVLRQADNTKEGTRRFTHCDKAWIPAGNPLGKTASPQDLDGPVTGASRGSGTFHRQNHGKGNSFPQ